MGSPSNKQPETVRLEEAKPRAPGRLMIPSLAISGFTLATPALVISLFLVDIARSFGVPVGVAGQIQTSFCAVTIVIAMLLGALSARFEHKLLIITGLFFISVSALGCSLAQDLAFMLLVYPLSGFGYAMISSMSGAMIGEYLPVEKRGTAMGWISAGMASSYLIGAPLFGFLGDWRLTFLAFTLPAAILSIFLALRFLPSSPKQSRASGSSVNCLRGFREIFRNTSAVACLLGNILCLASFQVFQIYAISFYRQRLSVPTGFASIILAVAALTHIMGSLVGGRLVNRFGRKTLAVLAALLMGLHVISFMFVPNLWLSQALYYLGCFFGGTRTTAGNSLALEQEPGFRGTMMSLNQAAVSTGQVIGNSFGGLMLLLYGYEGVGLSLGTVALVGSLVFLFLTTDPTRTPKSIIKS